MTDICNVVMGNGYLNSDWNQGNILNFGGFYIQNSIFYIIPVSYTHLDVYKRQLVHYEHFLFYHFSPSLRFILIK